MLFSVCNTEESKGRGRAGGREEREREARGSKGGRREKKKEREEREREKQEERGANEEELAVRPLKEVPRGSSESLFTPGTATLVLKSRWCITWKEKKKKKTLPLLA